MSTTVDQMNSNRSTGLLHAGEPNQIIPPGTVGQNPQSGLNPNGKSHLR